MISQTGRDWSLLRYVGYRLSVLGGTRRCTVARNISRSAHTIRINAFIVMRREDCGGILLNRKDCVTSGEGNC